MPNITRVAIFYDGSYLNRISNYYRHTHQRQAHLDFKGIERFVCDRAAEVLDKDTRRVQVVESHYFRGRMSLARAKERNLLETERIVDGLLMRSNVTTHYFPLKEVGDHFSEKGIDVWFSLEAYELALRKEYEVIALFAGDSDFLPLVRKLNGVGVDVLLPGWDISYEGDNGQDRWTRTSPQLLEAASIPLDMVKEIGDGPESDDEFVNGLFVGD